jgi:hypothetical protein
VYIFDANAQVYHVNARGEVGRLPGSVSSLGVGGDGTLFATSTEPTTGGFKIYKWNPTNSRWEQQEGGAIKVTVDGKGNPYIIDDDNRMHQRVNGEWARMPGRAFDIAAGPEGSLVAVSTRESGAGYYLYKWNFTTSRWIQIGDGAKYVTVGPYGGPIFIDNTESIFRSVDPCPGQFGDYEPEDIPSDRDPVDPVDRDPSENEEPDYTGNPFEIVNIRRPWEDA